MTCVDVRDRLTEHALGLLPVDESTDVERHLDWCAGCRKEASELQEAVAAVSFSLPEAAPPRGLEERIVGRLVDGSGPRSSGRDHRLGRRGIRSLVAATLAAVLVAMGAVGWAFAERHSAQTTEGNLQIARRLYKLIASLGGQPYRVQLLPAARFHTSGFAVLVGSRGTNNFIYVEVLPPTPATGPYTVQVVDRAGGVQSFGQLAPNGNGDLFYGNFTPQDLSKAITVSILDRASDVVLSGKVTLYSAG